MMQYVCICQNDLKERFVMTCNQKKCIPFMYEIVKHLCIEIVKKV